MNLFETVKTAVNAREAAQLYGVAVNRCGMALCPFHNDHHPQPAGSSTTTTTVLPAERTGTSSTWLPIFWPEPV